MAEILGRENALHIRYQISGEMDVALGNEYVTERDATGSWVAGSLLTIYTVGQTSDSTPNHGVMHLQSHVTLVRILKASRPLVNTVNFFTSYNQRVLLDDTVSEA